MRYIVYIEYLFIEFSTFVFVLVKIFNLSACLIDPIPYYWIISTSVMNSILRTLPNLDKKIFLPLRQLDEA